MLSNLENQWRCITILIIWIVPTFIVAESKKLEPQSQKFPTVFHSDASATCSVRDADQYHMCVAVEEQKAENDCCKNGGEHWYLIGNVITCTYHYGDDFTFTGTMNCVNSFPKCQYDNLDAACERWEASNFCKSQIPTLETNILAVPALAGTDGEFDCKIGPCKVMETHSCQPPKTNSNLPKTVVDIN